MSRLNWIETELPGVLLLQPQVFADFRGYFYESYRAEYSLLGLLPMVQANISRSGHAVLRGLHFQRVQPQAKLVSVVRGAVFDVAVDVRRNSPTFGQWVGHALNDENHWQMYIPVGFAHGFCVLSEEVDLHYQCSDYWHPASEVCIRWDDPELAVEWPIYAPPRLSEKDLGGVLLSQLSPDQLF